MPYQDSPSPNTQEDIDIRNQALHLLQQQSASEARRNSIKEKRQQAENKRQKLRLAFDALQSPNEDNTANISYGQQARRDSAPFVAQSYQQAGNATLEREREENRRYSTYPSSAPSQGEDLVDLLMPVVSCVSHACKVGISGIAQQAAQGVSMMKREAEDRVFSGRSTNEMQGSFQSVGIPSYQGSRYSDIPEATSASGGGGGVQTSLSSSPKSGADIMSC